MKLVGVIATCLALASCVTASETHKMAEKGGCADQDFITHVAGGKYCLSIATWKSKEIMDDQPTLIIAIHGDGGPKPYEQKIEKFIADNPAFYKANSILVSISRPGYKGKNGKSSGHPPDHNRGRTTYTPEVFNAVLEATNTLAKHYNVKEIKAVGFSGGAVIWASAIGYYPEKVPPNLNEVALIACACDIPKWESLHGWSNAGHVSISPHTVAEKTPKHVAVNIITAKNDTNTYPELGREHARRISNAGGNASFTEASSGGHDEVFSAYETQILLIKSIIGRLDK